MPDPAVLIVIAVAFLLGALTGLSYRQRLAEPAADVAAQGAAGLRHLGQARVEGYTLVLLRRNIPAEYVYPAPGEGFVPLLAGELVLCTPNYAAWLIDQFWAWPVFVVG